MLVLVDRSKTLEVAMTTRDSLNPRRFCQDCGLDAAVPHANSRECVEALQLEWNRLMKRLYAGSSDIPVSQTTSNPDNPNALSPRLGHLCEHSAPGAPERR